VAIRGASESCGVLWSQAMTSRACRRITTLEFGSCEMFGSRRRLTRLAKAFIDSVGPYVMCSLCHGMISLRHRLTSCALAGRQNRSGQSGTEAPERSFCPATPTYSASCTSFEGLFPESGEQPASREIQLVPWRVESRG
jgi:hypothetical protein